MDAQKTSPFPPAAAASDIPVPIRWSPAPLARTAPAGWTHPGLAAALTRGLAGRCPSCGKGRLFAGWLRQVEACRVCQMPLGAVRADDVPPYIVIFIVAHLVIGTQVLTDAWLNLALVAEAAIFLPLTLFLCVALLRPVKGATVGLILHLGLGEQAPMQP